MVGERTVDGLEIRLKPRGMGRFFGTAFLIFWLCGWAVGEGFALWILGNGVSAYLSGDVPKMGSAPMPTGFALAMGAFLLVWLTFWTVGGIAAMREVARRLWAEDRLIANPGALRVIRCIGPFCARREVPRDQITGVFLTSRGGLVAETGRGGVTLSDLGAPEERTAALEALRRELGLPSESVVASSGAPDGRPVELPPGWSEAVTPEGERALVPDPAKRKVQARIVGFLALVAGIATLFAAAQLSRSLALLPGAILAGLATLGLGWGAVWLARGRTEWRIGSGRLTMRRRFGSTARDVLEVNRLELNVSHDSDGDEWFSLDALDASAPPMPTMVTHRSQALTHRRRIAAALREPAVPRALGLWLASRASVPFEDRTTPEARRAEITELKAQLEHSGPVGKFAARLIRKAEERRQV